MQFPVGYQSDYIGKYPNPYMSPMRVGQVEPLAACVTGTMKSKTIIESVSSSRPQREVSPGPDVAGTLKLDAIQQVAKVSEGKALALMESCIWCLTYCQHSSGVKLRIVQSDETFFYLVTWPEGNIDPDAIRRSYNRDDAIEDGAEALAFLVCVERKLHRGRTRKHNHRN